MFANAAEKVGEALQVYITQGPIRSSPGSTPAWPSSGEVDALLEAQ